MISEKKNVYVNRKQKLSPRVVRRRKVFFLKGVSCHAEQGFGNLDFSKENVHASVAVWQDRSLFRWALNLGKCGFTLISVIWRF